MSPTRRVVSKSSRLLNLGATASLLRTAPTAAYQPCIDPAFRFFTSEKRLTEETISPALVNMRYAVRGEIVKKAEDIQHILEEHPEKLIKFDHVLYTNIGNPHGVGQRSLTWPRQVMALCNLPDEVGIDSPMAAQMFPQDVIKRAREIKHKALQDHGTGAYSHSQGTMPFREHIAKFIEKRDGGVKSDPNDIFMTNGASTAIDMILQTLLADETWYVCLFGSNALFIV